MPRSVLQVSVDNSLPCAFDALILSDPSPHLATTTTIGIAQTKAASDQVTGSFAAQGVLADARYVNTTAQRCRNAVQQSVIVRAWRPAQPHATITGVGNPSIAPSLVSTNTRGTSTTASRSTHLRNELAKKEDRIKDKTNIVLSDNNVMNMCVCEVYLIIYATDISQLMKHVPATVYLRDRCPHQPAPNLLKRNGSNTTTTSEGMASMQTKSRARRRSSGDGQIDSYLVDVSGTTAAAANDIRTECSVPARLSEDACSDEVSILHCYLDAVSLALSTEHMYNTALSAHPTASTSYTLHVIVTPDSTGRGRTGPTSMAEFYAELLSWTPLRTPPRLCELCAQATKNKEDMNAEGTSVQLGVCALEENVMQAVERVRSGVQALVRHCLHPSRSARMHAIVAPAASDTLSAQVLCGGGNPACNEGKSKNSKGNSSSCSDEDDVHDPATNVQNVCLNDIHGSGSKTADGEWNASLQMLVGDDVRPKQPRKCDPVDFLQLYRNMLCEISSLSERKTAAVINAFPTMYSLLDYIQRQQQEQKAVLQATGKHVELGSVYSRNFGEQRASNVLSDEIVDALSTSYFGAHAQN